MSTSIRFFDSIPHDVAHREVSKRAPDPFALQICDMCMEKHDGDHGVGLGSELSQLMALSVLDGIDHWAKEKAHAEAYSRYMDDSVAIFPTKEQAQLYLQGILLELEKRGLTPSAKKTLVFPLKQGINYLGWRYILKANGRIVCKPRSGKIAKTKRKLVRMADAGIPLSTIRQSLDSSIASLKWGDANKEIAELNRFYEEEIKNGLHEKDERRKGD